MRHPIRHLICDLDNTLYDWVASFVPSFYAMVDELVVILQCDRDDLLRDFKEVHVRNGDAEHGFAALETRTVQDHFSPLSKAEIAAKIDSALYAYNRTRKRTLNVYPGVIHTLGALRSSGIVLLAYSEAKFHSIVDRLTRLGLIDYFDTVYCQERSPSSHPSPETLRVTVPTGGLTKIIELKQHQRKPSPDVLREICDREGADLSTTAYVGDSLAKDVVMANQAGVFSIWAKYGSQTDPALLAKLLPISHWTPEEVAREAAFRTGAAFVEPDAVLLSGFEEIGTFIEPIAMERREVLPR